MERSVSATVNTVYFASSTFSLREFDEQVKEKWANTGILSDCWFKLEVKAGCEQAPLKYSFYFSRNMYLRALGLACFDGVQFSTSMDNPVLRDGHATIDYITERWELFTDLLDASTGKINQYINDRDVFGYEPNQFINARNVHGYQPYVREWYRLFKSLEGPMADWPEVMAWMVERYPTIHRQGSIHYSSVRLTEDMDQLALEMEAFKNMAKGLDD